MANNLIISIGSNFDQKAMVSKARAELMRLLDGDTRFTEEIWTEPVGMVSDRFLNCLCFSRTSLDYDSLRREVKEIERACGRTEEERHRNIVRLDIDILKYGDTVIPKDDWNREYVKELLKLKG